MKSLRGSTAVLLLIDLGLAACGGGARGGNPDAAPGAGGGAAGRAGQGGAGGAGGAATASCTPAARECRGAELAVCAADGTAWRTLACDNGCETPDAGATAAPGCRPTNLSTGWTLHKLPLSDDSVQTEAAYRFEADGLVAVQTANALPSAYVNDTVLANVVVKGRFTVNTASDDDLVGFVFGWQDPQHFYLLDWKQASQNDSTCGSSLAGVSLKRVSSDEPVNACADFWASAGTSRTTTLVPPVQNPAGWADFKAYDFTLRWKAGDIQIEIKDGDAVVAAVTSDDATWGSGKFGFYNYSQEQVRYEFFVIEPAP